MADHIILRPEVGPFPPQRADIINGFSSFSNTVDGLLSRLNLLSDQFSSLQKQVIFEHDSRNVEIDLDPNSIQNHLRESVQNWNSKNTQLYFESESLLRILESMIIENYSGRALSHCHMFCLELVRFWLPPGRHGRSSENLQMLLNFKVLLSLLIALELNLLISHTVKVKIVEELSEEKGFHDMQNQKSLLNP